MKLKLRGFRTLWFQDLVLLRAWAPNLCGSLSLNRFPVRIFEQFALVWERKMIRCIFTQAFSLFNPSDMCYVPRMWREKPPTSHPLWDHHSTSPGKWEEVSQVLRKSEEGTTNCFQRGWHLPQAFISGKLGPGVYLLPGLKYHRSCPQGLKTHCNFSGLRTT